MSAIMKKTKQARRIEMSELNITTSNFKSEVLESDLPVLVDFWASWCAPCRMMSSVIEELAKDYAGRVKVCKVNVDQEPSLAQQYKISGIPTVMVFESGEVKQVSVGYRPKKDIEKLA